MEGKKSTAPAGQSERKPHRRGSPITLDGCQRVWVKKPRHIEIWNTS